MQFPFAETYVQMRPRPGSGMVSGECLPRQTRPKTHKGVCGRGEFCELVGQLKRIKSP